MQLRATILHTAWAILVLAGILVSTAWYLSAKDYAGSFADRRGEYHGFDLRPGDGDSMFSKSWLTLTSTSDLRVECGVLSPRREGRYPVVIVLGGKATGKHAINHALDIEDVHVVAVDYPYDPRESYSLPAFLSDIPAIRRALLDMVPSVSLVMDYLATRPDVDTTRIILLGYSFGAPLVPVIAAHDRRPAFAAMVFGGGDLHGLIRHNVRRTEGALVAEFVAMVGGLLLRPLEPLRYATRISPMPLLMINGTEDEQIPGSNTEVFYDAASEPKKIIWIRSAHVRKENVELTRTIIKTLKVELASAGLLGSER